ncbi:hypothetical protein [Pelagicoccus sp. SDUM812002]|uniref:hypothetical protein n=1 Tax=Pelagicoccus sp. SDUM812002 TaxID=3041266 RepID=UPI00280EF6C8|nr:hypothetical protein [Pelagicoccus sp. SDUM812002]MDQ8188541.1 hypothetical protein [Pelagicoccus sp. SDUM812002]
MKTSNQELWMPIEIIGLIGLSSILSTVAYVKLASVWGSTVGGFLIWFATPIMFIAYTIYAYKRILSKDSESRTMKALLLAFITIVMNYLIPISMYGPYIYGPGP